MGWFDDMCGEIGDAQQETEEHLEKEDELEHRETALKQALTRLVNDPEVTAALESNVEATEEARQEQAQKREELSRKLEQYQKDLQAQIESNEESAAVISELASIGENVSDAQSIIEERRAILNECAEMLEDLSSRLSDGAGTQSGVPADALAAMAKSPTERTWNEVERVDAALHPRYETQKTYLTDPETGRALRDSEGHLILCSRNTKGAASPDLMYEDSEGVHIREDKTYNVKRNENGLKNLKQNIRKQAKQRRAQHGDDVDLTFLVAPNFTVGEAKSLQQYVEGRLNADLEWQHK